MQESIAILTHFIFILMLGFYVILNLQWYSYRLERVLLKHKKKSWHIAFFLVPLILFYVGGNFFWIFLLFAYIPLFFLWYKKLDKKLTLTHRVKRFFVILIVFCLIEDLSCFEACSKLGVIVPLVLALIVSFSIEKILFLFYKQSAHKKLLAMKNLKIIAITASYGKTSIKNFLYELIANDFNTYKTPASVNTEIGIIADINQKLPSNTQIYIAEAGARQRGDILQITRILQQDYAIIGQLGPQHLEYFKTLDTIKQAKREILVSSKMKKAFVHESAEIDTDLLEVFGENQGKYMIKNINASLQKLEWDLIETKKTIHFECSLLGDFNALNITAAFLMARELGIDEKILLHRVKNLKSIQHRLEKILAGGKIIIDDSFNGNIDGMLSSYELVKDFNGNKIIVTPGLVEANEELNQKLAEKINKIFDLVIITSDVNHEVLAKFIPSGKRKRVYNKKALELMLANETKAGDLILFSNDAPNFL